MENHKKSRQHQKSQVLPLHTKCVQGCTHSDTFFFSLVSTMRYTCIHVLYCILLWFVTVKLMLIESHSHGTFKDFIRYVGAPNVILTNNSQTQTGAKWTDNSHKHSIQQKATVPKNQHQNQVEWVIWFLRQKWWWYSTNHKCHWPFGVGASNLWWIVGITLTNREWTGGRLLKWKRAIL